ncbi:hypothetical protein PHYSODRAFT_254192 [Phytophthora sojae]|uniref:Uncharacterized protein n=1 Tax=Phytophthora sojae (strain P6497) TaxID=1094619 RepID=G5A8S4_PHYSP|nr:hypothetical protein PHYSODRAFT_254192 [Phytophthora sojae]EGZ08300.1 hypothetical protein PHYSODRAFT_254192 [Phytophthora sojae]|eukprot:XP_009536472.1 hypothetical protein PHYSODRAFT_254192 [Phytophthora sojae]
MYQEQQREIQAETPAKLLPRLEYFSNYEYFSIYEFFSSFGPSSGSSNVVDFRGTKDAPEPALGLAGQQEARFTAFDTGKASSLPSRGKIPAVAQLRIHGCPLMTADSSSGGVAMDSIEAIDVGPERPLTPKTLAARTPTAAAAAWTSTPAKPATWPPSAPRGLPELAAATAPTRSDNYGYYTPSCTSILIPMHSCDGSCSFIRTRPNNS